MLSVISDLYMYLEKPSQTFPIIDFAFLGLKTKKFQESGSNSSLRLSCDPTPSYSISWSDMLTSTNLNIELTREGMGTTPLKMYRSLFMCKIGSNFP